MLLTTLRFIDINTCEPTEKLYEWLYCVQYQNGGTIWVIVLCTVPEWGNYMGGCIVYSTRVEELYGWLYCVQYQSGKTIWVIVLCRLPEWRNSMGICIVYNTILAEVRQFINSKYNILNSNVRLNKIIFLCMS
jgi:hypothetical protein